MVDVSNFGAIPNDGINDQQALQKAINACKNKNATLIIPPGEYDIIDKAAIQLMNDIMDWKLGSNPQDMIYTPYYPYSIGLNFRGL